MSSHFLPITHILANLLEVDAVRKVEQVQNLWSNYGEIARYIVTKHGESSSIIVKQVCPPSERDHPRGWNTNVGHQRKVHSYQVEQQFYQHYSMQCNQSCRVAKFLACESIEDNQILVMEDLDFTGLSKRIIHASAREVKLALAWLAHFHARFMQVDGEGLWPIGTYWHLATRQEELMRMPDSVLKHTASKLDYKLNSTTHQTLVHGDAKIANFCFHEQADELAVVDFQYVGVGIGMKDVMYFLGSCLSAQELFELEDSLIDFYFAQLAHALAYFQPTLNANSIESEWRGLYLTVWADFHRFLAGWHPEHHKINAYMLHQTERALK